MHFNPLLLIFLIGLIIPKIQSKATGDPTVDITPNTIGEGVKSETTNAQGVPNSVTNWVKPEVLWNLFNFPVVPNPDESTVLLDLEAPKADVIDLTHYNLGLYNGVVNGTLSCDCGRPLGRIQNGKDARINNIPWTAAIAFKDAKQPFCGATLINNIYLLTAAHCLQAKKADELQIWLNDENYLLSDETKGGRIVHDVAEITRHPDYKAYFNDIALLKLNESLKLGSPLEFALVNPVCLPADAGNDYTGYVGTVAGWGKLSSSGKVSPRLQKTSVPIWSNDECQKETVYGASIKENMLCAGFKHGGTDACQGDSGGPLIIRQNVTTFDTPIDDDEEETEGQAVLVGIVSWGFGCAQPKRPGVYTRLNLYIKWILDNTVDAEYCHAYSSKKKV